MLQNWLAGGRGGRQGGGRMRWVFISSSPASLLCFTTGTNPPPSTSSKKALRCQLYWPYYRAMPVVRPPRVHRCGHSDVSRLCSSIAWRFQILMGSNPSFGSCLEIWWAFGCEALTRTRAISPRRETNTQDTQLRCVETLLAHRASPRAVMQTKCNNTYIMMYYDMIWYDMIWYYMMLYDIIWCYMILYDIIWCNIM